MSHPPTQTNPEPSTKRSLPKFKKNKGTELREAPAPGAPQSAPTPTAQKSAPTSNAPPPVTPKPPAVPTIPSGYTAATRWAKSAIFAYDTDFLPPDVSRDRISNGAVADDGLFGAFEYTRMPMPFDHQSPHMPYIRVPGSREHHLEEFRPASKEDLDLDKLLSIAEQKALQRAAGVDEKVIAAMTFKTAYFSKVSVHETARMRLHDLRNDFFEAIKLLQEVFHRRALKSSSIEHKVLSEMIIPRTIVSVMWKSWATMHWGGLSSMGEYSACHRVYQRAALETDAWLDMCASLMAPIVSKRPGHCLHRRLDLGSAHRRGAIMAGDDITTYQAVFRKLRVPTYAEIPLEAIDVKSVKFYEPHAIRSSAALSFKMSRIYQKTMPASWYTPQRAEWHVFELQARGYLARSPVEVDDFKPSNQLIAGKRKAENIQSHNKRVKLDQEIKDERLDDDFRRKHKDIGTSRDRYQWFVQHSPAFRRYFDLSGRRPPLWLAQPTARYGYVEGQLVGHAHLTEVHDYDAGEGKKAVTVNRKGPVDLNALGGSLFTFLPPVSLIATNPDRQARMIVNIVHALPMLLMRPALARKDPSVRRLGPRGWRLWGLDVVTEDQFWAPGGGKIGKLNVLGQKEFERLRALPRSQRPPWGKLPCGHDLTVESIKGKTVLIAGICYSLNQWHQLHWLTQLATPANLERADIPQLEDEGGKFFAPDFMGVHGQSNSFVPSTVRQIALMDKPINAYGWPQPWTPDTIDVGERRRWLKAFARFLSAAEHREDLDEYMKDDAEWAEWSIGRALADVNPFQPLKPEREDSLEDHLCLRYGLTSLMHKQLPIPILAFPCGSMHSCCVCVEDRRREWENDPMRGLGMTERFDEYDDLEDEEE